MVGRREFRAERSRTLRKPENCSTHGIYGALWRVSTLVKALFWIYLLFLLGVYGTQTNPADPDLWHRLAVGEFLWQTHCFPLGDTFSYLADYQKIADHEWGSALVFYGLWQWGGPNRDRHHQAGHTFPLRSRLSFGPGLDRAGRQQVMPRSTR